MTPMIQMRRFSPRTLVAVGYDLTVATTAWVLGFVEELCAVGALHSEGDEVVEGPAAG